MKQQQEIVNADTSNTTNSDVTSPQRSHSAGDVIDDTDVDAPFLVTARDTTDVDLDILLDDDVDATSATFTASGATVTSTPSRVNIKQVTSYLKFMSYGCVLSHKVTTQRLIAVAFDKFSTDRS